MAPTTKIFGGVVSEKRTATIAGVKVDISKIPSRYTLELMEATATKVDYRELTEILARICALSAPEITADFLLDNLELTEINDLVEYMIEPIMEKAKQKQSQAGGVGGKDTKN